MVKSHGFPKQLRLSSKKDIDQVFRTGRYHKLGLLQAKTLATGREEPRFLISVRKTLGTAPERNRIKRVVREAIRLNRNQLTSPHDICLFLTRRPRQQVCLSTVEKEILSLFGRLSPNRNGHLSDG